MTKVKTLSPVLTPSGKKKKRMKTKALVDSGASESILKQTAAKGIPLKRQGKETKSWSTAAGMLDTAGKLRN
jgi:hypothetical protein